MVDVVGGRRVLVLASQCDQMEELSFLPSRGFSGGGLESGRGVVVDLYEQLVDEGVGHCVAVEGLGDAVEGVTLLGEGLVVNPTRVQADAALKHALRQAAGESSGLFVYYIRARVEVREQQREAAGALFAGGGHGRDAVVGGFAVERV